jgi:hypothetical protein
MLYVHEQLQISLSFRATVVSIVAPIIVAHVHAQARIGAVTSLSLRFAHPISTLS